jgi:hypothetical protein
MIKHIVTAGCSFTQRDETWSSFIERDFKEAEIHNVGISGAGNYTISTLCINKTQSLLSKGVSPDEIRVLIQWSGVSRKSFIGERSSSLSVNFVDTKSPTEFRDIHGDSKFCWDIGRKNDIGYWKKYKDDYWSDECAFVETLENILRTQWFLKSSKINFVMFTSWDLFTLAKGDPPHRYNWLGWRKASDGLGQWDNERAYKNIENEMLKDIYMWSTHLWDMIDFKRFAFFENKEVKFGGILQWAQNMLPQEKWYYSYTRAGVPYDKHPSPEAHGGFYDMIIKPKIKEPRKKRQKKG